ncbi:RNA polymerase sigma-70 factor (family 1) [Pedobacter africanus]|uniref:RNA polymerase sigma-70 factor (ECF subfamily) n=1 Tax=Pedobacter africanus TaxID=151894 RepID=A0ACC6KWJ2_9SPHI|nr:RNA polymerase sigma-70 factor [Pedobacter africanus]MDR6783517.1 RNA polymerase sigma-70 factor (ECF subfamily) [Pedobacter africanus]
MTAYSTYTDQEITTFLKEGDQLAFTEIYNRYSGLLYAYAFKLTADRDVTKDMTQELFISLWDNRSELELKTSLSAYLYTAIRYKFLKQVAHQKVKAGYAEKFLQTFESGISSTEDYIEEKDLIRTVEKLVSELPPKMARAFVMSKLEFRTHQEIAEELNISEKTVKNLISQAAVQLKPKIGLSLLTVILFS